MIMPEIRDATWQLGWRAPNHGKSPGPRARHRCRMTLAPGGPLAARAAAISMLLDHPACDRFYLARAEQRGAAMVTADRPLIQFVFGTMSQKTMTDLRAFTAD